MHMARKDAKSSSGPDNFKISCYALFRSRATVPELLPCARGLLTLVQGLCRLEGRLTSMLPAGESL